LIYQNTASVDGKKDYINLSDLLKKRETYLDLEDTEKIVRRVEKD